MSLFCVCVCVCVCACACVLCGVSLVRYGSGQFQPPSLSTRLVFVGVKSRGRKHTHTHTHKLRLSVQQQQQLQRQSGSFAAARVCKSRLRYGFEVWGLQVGVAGVACGHDRVLQHVHSFFLVQREMWGLFEGNGGSGYRGVWDDCRSWAASSTRLRFTMITTDC